MEKKNIFIIVALVVLIGGFLLFYSFGEESSNNPTNQNTTFESGDVVATVNGEEIIGSDFELIYSQISTQQGVDPATLDEQTQNQFSSQVIETLVTQVLLKQAAEKSDIVVSEESIDLQVESAKGQFESDEAFQQALSTENLTEESLRNQIWESIIINSYLQQELNLSTVTATESEVAQVYEQAIVSSEAEAEAEVEVAAPLSDVYAQLEAMVIQQKQQELISQFTEKLRVDAEIEILI
jgi:hypothetical protein